MKQRLTALSSAAGALLRDSWPDASMVCGGALVSYGVSLIHWPSGFIVGGALLLSIGIIAARARTKAS